MRVAEAGLLVKEARMRKSDDQQEDGGGKACFHYLLPGVHCK
jgi:hypothetical protein